MDEHLMLVLLLLVTFIWLAIVAVFYLFRMHCPWYLIVPVSALIGMVDVTILLEPDKCNLVATASRDAVSESRRLPGKCTIDEIMSGKYDSYITDLVMGVNAKYSKETQTYTTGLFKTDKRKTS